MLSSQALSANCVVMTLTSVSGGEESDPSAGTNVPPAYELQDLGCRIAA